MMRRFDSHLFWGFHSPLSALTGSGLIILASGRFAFALVCAAALIWVYSLTALIFSSARQIMPSRGRMVILLFLSAFLCALFMLFVSFINPLLVLGTFFFIALIPPCCLDLRYFEALESVQPFDAASKAFLEAITLSGIILALALIREPLGMGTLSIPGGAQGVRELFNNKNADPFVPARIFSVSAGGLLLLGYIMTLFRYLREQNRGIRVEDLPEENQ